MREPFVCIPVVVGIRDSVGLVSSLVWISIDVVDEVVKVVVIELGVMVVVWMSIDVVDEVVKVVVIVLGVVGVVVVVGVIVVVVVIVLGIVGVVVVVGVIGVVVVCSTKRFAGIMKLT